ncbi:MAG: putative molybdenum carrier protein [Desulfobacterium sp.]|nr:putative molybdenum carrier protein [Desulfobacterium sp.]
MIKKIISGGQTGADRAALDTAIKFNIDHGGWVPLGRCAEDGVLGEHYQMQEMPTDSYPRRTEQNVKESHATLIITRGPLTGGSLLTKKLASTHKKPCAHLNLMNMDEFEAAVVLNSFIQDHSVEVLNVAGPRASSDPGIYRDVKAILETMIYMQLMETGPETLKDEEFILIERKAPSPVPSTVEEAVDFIVRNLTLRNRSLIANSRKNNIASLYFSMADYLKVKLALDAGNMQLIADCALAQGRETLDVEDAAMVILKRIKQRLERDHVLRVVP